MSETSLAGKAWKGKNSLNKFALTWSFYSVEIHPHVKTSRIFSLTVPQL